MTESALPTDPVPEEQEDPGFEVSIADYLIEQRVLIEYEIKEHGDTITYAQRQIARKTALLTSIEAYLSEQAQPVEPWQEVQP